MNAASQAGGAAALAADQELEQLREILLGEDFRRLLELREEINDDEQFSTRISRVIARAMELRSQSDTSIAEVLAPIIDQAVTGSVANDPERLANSIYPIMGPAIRKSIAEAINEMLDNLNSMLTLGMSWEAIGWRYTAWRTGRSYSEVALLNSLEFRVEQIFLIHRKTGLLLTHVAAEVEDARDPDMVSGMLSAIQSFLSDSFTVAEGEALDTMRLGDLSVLVCQGAYATLAAVIRGNAPASLRGDLTAGLERVHRRWDRELRDFDGDTDAFTAAGDELRRLLQSRKRERKRGVPWVALLVIAALMAAVCWWWYLDWLRDRQIEAMGQSLIEEPGIALIATERTGNTAHYTVLVDPDARDPRTVLGETYSDAGDIQFQQYSQVSLDDAMIRARAFRQLQPPPDVSLTVTHGLLQVTGRAETAWAEALESDWRSVPGARAVDVTSLQVRDPALEAQRERQVLLASIEQTRLEFDVASTEIGAYSDMIPELADRIIRLDAMFEEDLGRHIRIDIVGFTDETGSRSINHEIGTQRAETVRNALIASGVDTTLLNASDSLDYYNVDVSSERLVRLFVHPQ